MTIIEFVIGNPKRRMTPSGFREMPCSSFLSVALNSGLVQSGRVCCEREGDDLRPDTRMTGKVRAQTRAQR